MKDQIQIQAEAYAKATTNTRCASVGKCKDCGVRYCDYRSRVEAYKVGYETAILLRGCARRCTKRVPFTPNIQP